MAGTISAVHSGQRRAATGMLIVHSGQSRWSLPVALEQLDQAADRQHHDVVDHQGGDQERQDVGQERAIGKGGGPTLKAGREIGRAAHQRQQRVDKRLDELLTRR